MALAILVILSVSSDGHHEVFDFIRAGGRGIEPAHPFRKGTLPWYRTEVRTGTLYGMARAAALTRCLAERVSLGQCHVAGRLRTILLISLRGGLSLIHEVDT